MCIYEERFFCIYCGACKIEPQYNSWEEKYIFQREEWFLKQITDRD